MFSGAEIQKKREQLIFLKIAVSLMMITTILLFNYR